MNKISAAILDFAQPLTATVAEGASPQAREDAMRLGIMIWNALVAQRLGDPSAFQAALARCRELPEPHSGVMATLIGQLVERKMERHADDVRLVRDWKLTLRENDEATLWVETAVSKPA